MVTDKSKIDVEVNGQEWRTSVSLILENKSFWKPVCLEAGYVMMIM